jgi:hypothetical protein
MLVFLHLAYHASIRLPTIYLLACLPTYLRIYVLVTLLFVFLRGHDIRGTTRFFWRGGWVAVRWKKGVAYMHY